MASVFAFTFIYGESILKPDLHCYEYQASNAIVLAIRTILSEETFQRKHKKQIA